jgi:hypothetical protein
LFLGDCKEVIPHLPKVDLVLILGIHTYRV